MQRIKQYCTVVMLAVVASHFLLPTHVARADLTIYTDASEFASALAAAGYPSSTLDFESITPGSVFLPGASIGDITFQNFGAQNLIIDNQYATTSGNNYLGMDDGSFANQFLGGYEFDMQFTNSHAIGMFIVTGETPGFSIFDDDILVTVPGVGTAALDVDDLQATIGGSDRVFFIGMIDTMVTFTDASVRYSSAAVNSIVFNVDDLTTSGEFLLGDVNRDGNVNLLDVEPFIAVVSDGTFQLEADTNQDGTVNLLDVQPFIDLLGGG